MTLSGNRYQDRGYTLGRDPYKDLQKKKPTSYDTKTGTYISSTGKGYSVSTENVSKIESPQKIINITSRKVSGGSSKSSSNNTDKIKEVSTSQILSQNIASRTSPLKPGQAGYLEITNEGVQPTIYTSQETKSGTTYTPTQSQIDTSNLVQQAKQSSEFQRREIAEITRVNNKNSQGVTFKDLSESSGQQTFRDMPAIKNLFSEGKVLAGIEKTPRELKFDASFIGATEVGYKAFFGGILPKENIAKGNNPYFQRLEMVRGESWSKTVRRGEVKEAGIFAALGVVTGGTGKIAVSTRSLIGVTLVGKGGYTVATAKTGEDVGFGVATASLGVLAIPKSFYPIKYEKINIQGVGDVKTVGFDVGTRGYPVVSRFKTGEGAEFSFGTKPFKRTFGIQSFEAPVSFPETAVGGKAYLKSLDVTPQVKFGVSEALVSGRTLGRVPSPTPGEYITGVEGLKNPLEVSKAVESATYDKFFGIKTRTSGTLAGTDPARLIFPKDYGVIRPGDVDVVYPRKTTEQVGFKLGKLTEKLNVIEGKGSFTFNPDENVIYFKGGKKFLEAKSGINQDILGLSDVAPSRVGGLRMTEETVRFKSGGRTYTAGQQFIRKLSASLIASPGGKSVGETRSFSEPGFLGKNVLGNPRGSKDVADFFSYGEGLVLIGKGSSKKGVIRRASRGERALKNAFENIYTPEQRVDILAKRTERTGKIFDDRVQLRTKKTLFEEISVSSKSLSASGGSFVSRSFISDISRGSKSISSKSPLSSSSFSSASIISKSPISSVSKSPISSSSFSPTSIISKSPISPRSPSPYSFSGSSFSPRPSIVSPPIRSGSGGSPSDGGGFDAGFGLNFKRKAPRGKETKFFVIPDLRSVFVTEQALGGKRAMVAKQTSQVRSLSYSALRGQGVGFVPTEQIRTGKVKLR